MKAKGAMRRLWAGAAAAAAVLSLASGAQASVVLDQANLDMHAGLNGVDHQWQQQVTAGVQGRLAGLTLWGIGSARVRVAQGHVFYDGPFAFSQVVSLAPTGTYIDLLPANIALVPGDTFVINLTEATNGYGAAIGAYAGGDLWMDNGARRLNFTDDYNISLRFETYVAVPEPATWALMIGGFGLAGAMLRRRTAAAA